MAPWILFTVFAAAMQSVRTAGQKSLSATITPMSATGVRYVLGLPFAIAYLLYLVGTDFGGVVITAMQTAAFVKPAVLASVAQILATALLIRVFRYQNFMVGTSFAKTESIQTALIGTFFFAAPIAFEGWIAVVLGVVGVWLMAMPSRNQPWQLGAIAAGLGSGAFFALTSLWIRQASNSLDQPIVVAAAITLVLVVALQSILCLTYTSVVTPGDFKKIHRLWPLALFVGATSALGSIGWFTAMSWENPALVKSVGQIEMIFTAVLTLRFFRERVRLSEWLGVGAVIASVVILIHYSAQ